MNANFAFTLKLLCHFVTPLLSTEEELVLLAVTTPSNSPLHRGRVGTSHRKR